MATPLHVGELLHAGLERGQVVLGGLVSAVAQRDGRGGVAGVHMRRQQAEAGQVGAGLPGLEDRGPVVPGRNLTIAICLLS